MKMIEMYFISSGSFGPVLPLLFTDLVNLCHAVYFAVHIMNTKHIICIAAIILFYYFFQYKT